MLLIALVQVELDSSVQFKSAVLFFRARQLYPCMQAGTMRQSDASA